MATDYKAQTDELEKILRVPVARPLYDFAPCLTAPAVQKVASVSANTPILVSIPPSPYASPFADNLTPDVVKSLHDHLCGPANDNNKGKHRQRGKEVWLSWKRAWDLYNNHYIEGRENPTWIAQEYKKLKKEFEDERAALRLKRLNQSSSKVRYSPPTTSGPLQTIFGGTLSPKNRPGRKWRQTGFKGWIVEKKGEKVSLERGDISFIQDASAKKKVVHTLPDRFPTKVYVAGEDVPVLQKKVPKYRTTVEYVLVASPTKPMKLASYHDLCNERQQGNKSNTIKETAFFKARNDARNMNPPLPFNEDFKSTIAPSLVEDAIEDTTIEVEEVLMKRPIGVLEVAKVETDGLIRPPLGYNSLQNAREKKSSSASLNESGIEKKINKTILVWKETATRVISLDSYRLRPRLQRYPKDLTEVDLTEAEVVESTTNDFSRASEGTQVDELTLEPLLEWEEINWLSPDRRIKSHAHSAATPATMKKHVSFSMFNKGTTSLPQAATRDHGIFLTDIDDPNVMYPTSYDSTDPDNMPTNNFQSIEGSPIIIDDDDNDDESDSEEGLSINRFNRRMPSGSYIEDRDAPVPCPGADDVEEKDGSHQSGGFKPMKYLPDYIVPDVDDRSEDEKDWTDAIENTVWIPRRTGETILSIGLDEDVGDLETNLAVLGGVDCGRSPYPVLRSVEKYVEFTSPSGNGIVKKRVWDGVTGTIFNMPSQPLENQSNVRDERLTRMKMLHGDYFRDVRDQPNKDIFPLDIRRLNRVDTVVTKRRGPTPLLRGGEKEVQFAWRHPLRLYPVLQNTDPWWVTTEQETLRDVPPRRYPPPDRTMPGDLLYTDDTGWQEEVDNDSMHHSGYFVTNIHGGTLIINGVEVRKGHVAGPLPDFAVIECPGNQVAFWHGPGGRFRGEGLPNSRLDSRWQTLRQLEGFEKIALSAGQVWNMLIKDRLRRELTGNRLEDDEEWAFRKSFEPAPESVQPTGPMRFPEVHLRIDFSSGLGGRLPADKPDCDEPESFLTQGDEFRWLKTRAIPLEVAASRAVLDSTIRPTVQTFWAIDPSDRMPDPPEVIEQRKADTEFETNQVQILNQQRAATKHYEKEKTREEQEAAAKSKLETKDRKRKHDAIFPQSPVKKKKTRLELDRDQLLADKRHQAEYMQATEDKRIWREHINREAAKARKKADNSSFSNQDWEQEVKVQLDTIHNRWLQSDRERREAGLASFGGLNPRQQALVDEKRLQHLLQKAVDIKAEQRKKVGDRKHAKAAKEKADQAKQDTIQQKNNARSAKRNAAEAQLTSHQKRACKRKAIFDSSVPVVEKHLKRLKINEQQSSNIGRVNRDVNVNGLYGKMGVSEAVVPPTIPPPLSQILRPMVQRDFRGPASSAISTVSPTPLPSHPVYQAPPDILGIENQTASEVAPSSSSSPAISSARVIPNRASMMPPLETLAKSAMAPETLINHSASEPVALPTLSKANDKQTSTTSAPERPTLPSDWNSPEIRHLTPHVSTSINVEASSATSSNELLFESLSTQLQGYIPSSPEKEHSIAVSQSQCCNPPVPQQEILPASGFDPSDYMTQEDLGKLSAKEQLDYVLNNGLELVSEAPKCQHHVNLIETHGAENIDVYLAANWASNPTITAYLNAQREKTAVVISPVDVTFDWKQHWRQQKEAMQMQRFIRTVISFHYKDKIQQAKFPITEQQWAINKYARDTEGTRDDTMTFERLMDIMTEDVVKDLEQFPHPARRVAVGNLIARKLKLDAKIAEQEGKFMPYQIRRNLEDYTLERMCDL